MTYIVPTRTLFVRWSLVAGLVAVGVVASPQRRSPAPAVVAVEVPSSAPACSSDRQDSTEDGEEQQVLLSLDVTRADPACAYYSAFDVGDVELPRGAQTTTLAREFDFADGCHWRSEEQLDRLPDGRYRYTYRERPISCRPGAHAAAACTRSGFASAQPDDE